MVSRYQCCGGQIEYATTGNGTQWIVFFPPGIKVMDHWFDLVGRLVPSYRILLVNFPGTGRSVIPRPGVVRIARAMEQLIVTLGITDPVLVGESCGGDVAIELARKIPVKGLLLMATGEYFSPFRRAVLHTLFLLPSLSSPLRKSIAVLLSRVWFPELGKASGRELHNISFRWMDILRYRLPVTVLQVPAVFIHGTCDRIIDPGSIGRLRKIFPRGIFRTVGSGHISMLDALRTAGYKPFLDGLSAILSVTPIPVPRT